MRLILACISLILVTPLGILSKNYTGIAQEWVHNYAGDILIEIFLCLLLFIFISRKNAIPKIVLIVFLFSAVIEFTQLIKTPFLNQMRSYFLGRLILGTTFAWEDFPYYILGCILGWGWLIMLEKIASNYSQKNYN
ncbi:MAG: DUF2809 domain-containing protein [Moorea sp. SIO2B7]|nr:DUF2809 domain-containing protein [Moorena sp. SIO2B7]